MLISFAVTSKLICVFVLAYAKIRFSHDVAQIRVTIFKEGAYHSWIHLKNLTFHYMSIIISCVGAAISSRGHSLVFSALNEKEAISNTD